MTLIRFGFWALLICLCTGCRMFSGGGARSVDEKGSPRSLKDKAGQSFRIHGSAEPELFPAQFLPREAGPRPHPGFKQEDIYPSGGARTLPATDLAPKFPPAAPPTLTRDPEPRVEKEREPVVEALQCILDGQHNEALAQLRKYDPATQDLFLRLLPPLAQLSRKSLDRLTPPEIAVLHEQLQSLLTTLRPRTELTIDRMCFCEWVKGYGVYRPLPEGHHFHASTPRRPGDLVQLYVELRNVASELRGEYFETRLTSTIEIHDVGGARKWPLRFDEKEPFRTRTLLNDFFNVYSFHVPNLPPGTYNLTVRIADETRPELRRMAHRALEFRVTAVGR